MNSEKDEQPKNEKNNIYLSPQSGKEDSDFFGSKNNAANQSDAALPLSQAAKITGYHQDYLGALCRSGKLKGFRIGRNWFIKKSDLNIFQKNETEHQSELLNDESSDLPIQPKVAAKESAAKMTTDENGDLLYVLPASDSAAMKPESLGRTSEQGQVSISHELQRLKNQIFADIASRVVGIENFAEKITSDLQNLNSHFFVVPPMGTSNIKYKPATIPELRNEQLVQQPDNLLQNVQARQSLHQKFAATLPVTEEQNGLAATTLAVDAAQQPVLVGGSKSYKKLLQSFTMQPLINKRLVTSTALIAAIGFAASIGWSYFMYGNTDTQNTNTKFVYETQSKVADSNADGGNILNSQVIIPSRSRASGSMLVKGTSSGKSTAQLLSQNTDLLYELIDSRLNQYLAQGKFVGPPGPQGTQGLPGIQGTPGTTYTPATYFQPNSSNNFTGGSVVGVTEFSADEANINQLSAQALAVSGNSVFNGNTTFNAPSVFNNSLTLNGTTTIAHLSAGDFDPGFTPGSVIFQGAGGLAQDNTNLFYDSTNHRFGLGTTTPSETLTVDGDGLLTGNLTVNTLYSTNTTTTANLIVSNTSQLATTTISSLLVNGNEHITGTSTVDESVSTHNLAVSNHVTTDLIPDINASQNLGSPSYYWNGAYINTLYANSISAASTSIAGTASQNFTINSGNNTVDTENMNLIFFRGVVQPNAVISWDAAAKQFNFNQPTIFWNQSGSTTQVTLTAQGFSGQTGNLLQAASSTGAQLFAVSATGDVMISGNLNVHGTATLATTTIANLTVSGNSNLASVIVGGNATTTGNQTVGGNLTINGNEQLTGAFYDGTNSPGSSGYVLQSTGSATQWVATSTLGFLSSAITSLNGLTASSQTFATGSDTNIGLMISSSGSTHTFTPTWTGVLAANRGGTGTTTLGSLTVGANLNISGGQSVLIGTATQITLGPTVVTAVNNDTNVTGSIANNTLTLGWAGTLAAGRLNSNVVQSVTNDSNITGTISAQNLTLGFTGQLPVSRGGTGAAALTQYDLLAGNGTNPVATIAPGSISQVLTSAGNAAYPVYSNISSLLTAGSNIAISGTSTIAVVASPFFSNVNVSGTLAVTGTSTLSTTNIANLTVGGTTTLATTTATALVINTINGNTIQAGSGALNLGSSTLTLSGNSFLNQDLRTTASPTFTGLTLSNALTIANGGTNTTTLGSAGSVVYSNGSGYAFTAVGSPGYVLQSNGSGAPAFVSTSSLGFASASSINGTSGYDALFTTPTTLGTGIVLDSSSVAGINATSSSYTFNIQGGSGVNPLNVASSSGTSLLTVLGNGNVGIATTTPTTPLYVNGSASFVNTNNPRVILLNSTNGDIEMDSPTNDNLNINRFTTAGILLAIGGGNVTIGTTTATSARLIVQGTGAVNPLNIASSSGVSLLTVQANGNVGIGTSTPTNLLEVQGSGIAVGEIRGTTQAQLSLNGTTGIGQILNQTGILYITNNTANAIVFRTGGANEWMRITSTGNVGIGTISPISTLDVQGTGSTNPFVVASSSGNQLLTVLANGNVGIGTTTPNGTLTVNGTYSQGSSYTLKVISTTNVAQYTNLRADTGLSYDTTHESWELSIDNGSDQYAIYRAAATTTAPSFTKLLSLGNTGNLVIAGSLTQNGSPDISENVIVSNPNVAAGDVVMIDPTYIAASSSDIYDTFAVTKATTTDGVLGVISTKPGILINATPQIATDTQVEPLTLSGRVPVKVTNENGNIEPGDYLTVSKQFPGYAMKATYSGLVVGQALEVYNSTASNSAGTILAFVKVGYQNINNTFIVGEDSGDQLSGQTGSLPTTSPASFIINQVGSGNLLQLQQNGINKLLVDNSGDVQILSTPTTTITNVLSVQSASSTLFSINSVGDAQITGKIIVAKDTAGTAVVKAGDNKVTVTFASPYPAIPKIIISVDGLPSFYYGVTQKSTAGFTIETSKLVANDTSFDWVAVVQPDNSNLGQSGQDLSVVVSAPAQQGGGTAPPPITTSPDQPTPTPINSDASNSNDQSAHSSTGSPTSQATSSPDHTGTQQSTDSGQIQPGTADTQSSNPVPSETDSNSQTTVPSPAPTSDPSSINSP